ncbi:MAG: DUF3800 domain-containing protein [Nitrospirae bacterium]|nr:DUF3800 domain-containing protein [Nitrospirota bacterium]
MSTTQAEAMSHIAFADEKGYNEGRYRGIALVTLPQQNVNVFRHEMQRLLRESEVREFKWEKLASARERFAALKMIDFAIEKALNGSLRIDVLTWDTEDSRHKIPKRDDIANLERMYYHLLKYVLCERWPDGSIWALYPDENTALKWNSVQDCLDCAGRKTEIRRDLFTKGKFALRLKQEFRIELLSPCKSHQEPLVQLADLFAGISVYSRSSYASYQSWEAAKKAECSLFPMEQGRLPKLSKSNKERCCVMFEFNNKCKSKKLGVSLKTHKGLKTPDAKHPINFWWYEPQHEADKAPCKLRT